MNDGNTILTGRQRCMLNQYVIGDVGVLDTSVWFLDVSLIQVCGVCVSLIQVCGVCTYPSYKCVVSVCVLYKKKCLISVSQIKKYVFLYLYLTPCIYI